MNVPFQSIAVRLVAVTLTFCLLTATACVPTQRQVRPEVDTIDIGTDLTLRRMITRGANAKGTLLLLHGFPETLHTWDEVSAALADEFEVHSFDWPGYGQSSRPPVERFSYSPREYAAVLEAYISRSNIDTSTLVIYGTDIGALPALLLALDEPTIARTIFVGDFAPFDRPQYMNANLQSLKSRPSSDLTRARMKAARDEILQNAHRRGLSESEQFELPKGLADDMAKAWRSQETTPADALYYYYASFTRDQNYLEANLHRLRTPTIVIWGEKDVYINKAMGDEFAGRTGAELRVLSGIGHYPHLQSPGHTIEAVRTLLRPH